MPRKRRKIPHIDDLLYSGQRYATPEPEEWHAGRHIKDEPVNYVIDEILTSGAAILFGKPKVGKSWLALGLCAHVAAGRDVFGYPCEAAPVLYVGLEDSPRRIRNRLRQLEEQFHWLRQAASNISYITEFSSIGAGFDADISAQMKRRPNTKLIVIDVLEKIRPVVIKNGNHYSADYKIGANIVTICKQYPKLAIVVVHHSRKQGSESPFDSISGTLGLNGGYDTLWAIIDQNEKRLCVTGRDLEKDVDVILGMVDGKYSFNRGTFADNDGLSETRRAVIKYFKEKEGNKPSRLLNVVDAVIPYVDTGRQAVQVQVLRLTRQKVLKRVERGRYILHPDEAVKNKIKK